MKDETELCTLLRSRALTVVSGPDYNDYRQDLSEEIFFYEAVVPEGAPPSALNDKVLPGMARYLRGRKRDIERPHNVLCGIFCGDRCYVIEGAVFVALFRQIEGLSPAAFHERVVRWVDETA